MIQCRKCINTSNASAIHVGQTKRALRERFGEHSSAIENKITDAVPQHFNQKGNKLTDVEPLPVEFVNCKRESIRRARESFSMHPHGINREDEFYLFLHFFYFYYPILV